MAFPLVTTSWLHANLDNEKLILIDVSMKTVVGKEPIVYEEPLFIPNSQRLDIETSLCDLNSNQIHAFPTTEQFTYQAQKLGINSDSIVIIYDNQGIYSAPRAWWTFQVMGFKNAFVLDGGLPQWLSENREVVSTSSGEVPKLGNIKGEFQTNLVCDSTVIFKNRESGLLTVLDARSKERFFGLAPEPRAGVRSGHIPNSLSLPFSEVLNGHCFKSPEQLTALFSNLLANKTNQLVFSCGSGITACIILLAAIIAGYDEVILYDGSWADWGSNLALPVSL